MALGRVIRSSYSHVLKFYIFTIDSLGNALGIPKVRPTVEPNIAVLKCLTRNSCAMRRPGFCDFLCKCCVRTENIIQQCLTCYNFITCYNMLQHML